MRTLFFVAIACGLVACSRGNGSTTPMNSRQPLVSVVGCVTQTDGALVLTATPSGSASTPVGTTGGQATSGVKTTRRYRLIDEAHTGVDRYVDRQVQITGKVENPGAEEAATLPAIRVTQMNSLGGCDQK